MTPLLSGKALLVAFTEGLPPHAEALVCDDLRGPHSLFGEGMNMPRPIRELTSCCRAGDTGFLPVTRHASLFPYSRCSVLWESDEAESPLVMARTIIEKEFGSPVFNSAVSVPAPTYIAGQTTSSFALAWHLARDGHFPEWSSVLCSCQTEGRGQLRRSWHSPRGNLHVTFRLPAHPALQGDAASLVVGYLMVKAFRFLGFPVSLKWPNDLLLDQKRKVGGILLEERDGIVMAGMGINIAEAPSGRDLRTEHAVPAAVLLPHHADMENYEARAWRGLSQERCDDLPLAPFALWKQLVTGAILEYSHSVARQGLPYVVDCLNGADRRPFRPVTAAARPLPERPALPPGFLAWKDKRVILADAGPALGRLVGVGSGGGLLLALDDGEKREFFSGSLSLTS